MNNNPSKTSKKGKDLIRHFEGNRLRAYVCPAGVLTVGVGHAIQRGKTGVLFGKPIKEGDLITAEQSEALLSADLDRFEKAVVRLVKVRLNQDQFDALVSFAFNCGEAALSSSTLLRNLNRGDYAGVPVQLLRWNKANGRELAGLTRRRRSEGVLFSQGRLVFNFN